MHPWKSHTPRNLPPLLSHPALLFRSSPRAWSPLALYTQLALFCIVSKVGETFWPSTCFGVNSFVARLRFFRPSSKVHATKWKTSQDPFHPHMFILSSSSSMSPLISSHFFPLLWTGWVARLLSPRPTLPDIAFLTFCFYGVRPA